ncbi:MAG TPA: NADP-dependent phosphogluconate dehydrogenase [Candidatus Saccharimonadales bacterium]|nr:NADP-dependent phosphogluconate dehydrogenase [Candidatus Saccharimonadales bacterium]
MRIGFSGLGRMGGNMVARLLENGHEVVVLNRSPEPVEEAVKLGAIAATDYKDLASKMNPAIIWLMLPENITQDHVTKALEALPEGGILINGANSRYTDSTKYAEQARQKKVLYLDVGTSGGILGRKAGYAMMIGGDEQAVEAVRPILESLAPAGGGWGCFGPAGAGHFVKMVHNAIEYGMMESYVEGYRMLKEGPYKGIDLAKVGGVWQHGSIVDSLLNEMARQALAENPEMTGVEGVVAESGEARWTLETAKELNMPMPSIQAAFDVRLASQKGEITYATKLLAAIRNKFGGHALNPTDPNHSEAEKGSRTIAR